MVPNAIARIAAVAVVLASQGSRAAEQPAVPVPPSPAPVSVAAAPQPQFGLFWRNEAPSCDSGAVEPVDWVAPQAQFVPRMAQRFPVTIAFGIDHTGRAVDIRVLEGGYVEGRAAVAITTEQGTVRVPATASSRASRRAISCRPCAPAALPQVRRRPAAASPTRRTMSRSRS